MSTIVTRRIEGSGPYAYRVTYRSADGRHHWEYLGPVGAVDPEGLTDEETAQLREEGFGLARHRVTTSHDLRRLEVANGLRDRLEEGVLAPTDDRRSTVVELAEDAPTTARQLLEAEAEDMAQELDKGAGQAALTEAEKGRIDFTETTIPEAQAAKAAILDEGIDDWTSVWSEDLTGVGEARQAARDNRQSIGGDRLDNEEGPDERTTSNDEMRSEAEKQALKYAKEGDADARAYLLEERGWTASEIETTPVAA
ncbi:hypothetical protein PN417_09910 [Halorubrum ezzemoulense]|uniref:hypothetical protein n=1 Tax=Halorubrum ezzemoulense TaxID=337243 RepID=UPI00232D0D7A|nr:hypothetical protein [Halorubrum ezzemoulense]MDB9301249.1 hypothetical protein [Halorubrum ezzemoulense]